MKVLELYSGIGGMHWALIASGIEGKIIASVEINPTANAIYRYNFPEVNLLNRNIQCLTPKYINSLDVDTILMSPPCQPFTRNGLQKDIEDERTDSFKYLLSILPELTVDKILMENVKGFETSRMHDLFVETLTNCGYNVQEFILSPIQFGVPNSRHRYYCLANKLGNKSQQSIPSLLEAIPGYEHVSQCYRISEIVENDPSDDYKLSDKILSKYLKLLDISYLDSTNTCCFTKAYGRFIEGTGSVLSNKSKDVTRSVLDLAKKCEIGSPVYLDSLQPLGLRFFTPKEVSRLMSFPDIFGFPEGVTDRQKYAVLGNSLNVKVVGELLKLLNKR